ncbi:tyrosine-type recombinase/integrase [Chloroflexota bacterium]
MSELADEHDLRLLNSNSNVKQLLYKFLKSRGQGISPHTILFYKRCLRRLIASYELTSEGINTFLTNLSCNNGGELAYYRAIRAFCNWLVRSDYIKDNPIKKVDPPKPGKPLLPSLTAKQVNYLIEYVDSLRDKAIISLLADSGMRLNELTDIKAYDIDCANYTITIWGKGNKWRKAPFTEKTARLLRELISQNGTGEYIWHMKPRVIQNMLLELAKRTSLPCNSHIFRRGFACNLHRKGLSTLDIMHLGGWSDLSMVLRYTRSITFDDCLKHYREVEIH